MHYLRFIKSEIDKTHPGLGGLIAAAMVSVKAGKLLMVVSPRGCGKSRGSSFIATSTPNSMPVDRLSVAGIANYKEQFNGFDGLIVVDDIAKTQTPYARVATITTLCELIYSHYIVSHLSGMHFEIKDFRGSAIVNVQPVLLRDLVMSNEWEASIQDKSMRYYHLLRPMHPNPLPPKVKLEWHRSINDVPLCNPAGKMANTLIRTVEVQWGSSRVIEHVGDMLRAAAALDNRKIIHADDYKVLADVLAPLRYESLITDKTNFESNRYLDANKLALLTEYITYGQFSIDQLCHDYKISQGHAYRLMAKYTTEWTVISKSPTTYSPSAMFQQQLLECGIKPRVN